jgi:hypothetical protein
MDALYPSTRPGVQRPGRGAEGGRPAQASGTCQVLAPMPGAEGRGHPLLAGEAGRILAAAGAAPQEPKQDEDCKEPARRLALHGGTRRRAAGGAPAPERGGPVAAALLVRRGRARPSAALNTQKLGVAACTPRASPNPQSRQTSAAAHGEGRCIFIRPCRMCHLRPARWTGGPSALAPHLGSVLGPREGGASPGVCKC